MNKAELIDAIASRLNTSKRDVSDVVEAIIEETKKAVSRGDKVALSGFGVFERQERGARLGRNPRTGETVKIKATKLPKFRPGAEFKAVVSGAKKLVAKAPAKKAAPAVKKAAPARKAAPAAKKAAPAVKKAAPARKAAPAAKKAAPAVKKAAPARKAAPAAKKAAPAVKKAAPARKAAPAAKKAPAKKAPAKRTAAKR